jgi:hypothetical protein
MDTEQTNQIFDKPLFPKIFQTFRIAIQPSKLIIAFFAVAVVCLAGWLMDFSKTVVTTPYTRGQQTELQVYIADPPRVKAYIEGYRYNPERLGVFSALWHYNSARFHDALNCLLVLDGQGMAQNIAYYFKSLAWALRYHTFYFIIFLLIKLAVISVAAGGICRIAALQFARGEKPGLTEALRFGLKQFTALFTAPLIPVVIIILIGLCIFFLGLVGNIPWAGELIVAISTPLALIAGALIAAVIIGTLAGFNLIFPSIAYDGSDNFDAISRSFSYVFTRPWRMAFYTAVAAVYGAICYIFVRFFAFLLLWSARLFLQSGLWADSSNKGVNKLSVIWPTSTFMNLPGPSIAGTTNWSESIAAFLIHLCVLVVVGLVVAFVISFYFSANTIIYALMRNKVDETALEDIYTPAPPDETKAEPAATELETEEAQSPPEEEPPQNSSSSAEQQNS